jgi:hypothetical protein
MRIALRVFSSAGPNLGLAGFSVEVDMGYGKRVAAEVVLVNPRVELDGASGEHDAKADWNDGRPVMVDVPRVEPGVSVVKVDRFPVGRDVFSVVLDGEGVGSDARCVETVVYGSVMV